jgi:ribonuclease HI
MTPIAAAAPDEWTVFCDGSAHPNPGRMGIGAVITAPDGARQTLSVATQAIGCNNEAELRALTAALEALKAQGATAVRAFSDNSVLVAQLAAVQAKPVLRMATRFGEARALLATFERASVQWIPRHRNVEADALARAALDLPAKPSVKSTQKRRR